MIEQHFYLRTRAHHPVGVIAMRKEGDSIRVAASLCSPSDPWDKKLGILRAKARLNSKKSMLVQDTSLLEVLRTLMPSEPWWKVNMLRASSTFQHQVERMLKP